MTRTLPPETIATWLEAYGADPARWPDPVAGRATLARHPDLARQVNEAKSLDRLLVQVAATTGTATTSDDLINRIATRAERSPRLAASNATAPPAIATAPAAAHPSRLPRRAMGGLLAASLLLGLGLGLTPVGGQVAGPAVSAFSSGDTAQSTDIALAQAAADIDDETGTTEL
jgi:hypothetical protein